MARRRTELVKADAGKRLPLRSDRRGSGSRRAESGPENAGGIEILEGPQQAGADPATDPAAGAPTGTGRGADGDATLPIRRESGTAAAHQGAGAVEHPEDVLAQPPDARDISAELAAPPRRKLPWLTLVLSACVVAAAAFSGGALVEKNHLHDGSTTGSRFGQAAAAAAGRTGTGASGRTGGGFGGFGGGTGSSGGQAAGGAGVTTGTVKLVDGKTLYVSDAQGNIVKVTTGGSTKVTESKSGKVGNLKAGQSVTVLGTKGSDGSVTATTVTEGSTPGGAFGGFGGGGSGAGSGTAGGSGN